MSGAAALLPNDALDARRLTRPWLVPLLVGAGVLAVAASVVDGLPVGATNDDGMYVILAKSIATGHGYHWIHLPGAPSATHFPPGYPALLALLWWLVPGFPANLVLFKLANAFFLAIAAAGTFLFATRRLAMSDAGAALLTFAATLGIPTLTLSTIVMSEMLFLALLIPALLLAEGAMRIEGATVPEAVTLAILAGLATLVRSHGIALVAAILFLLCARRQLRSAAIFGGITLAILAPWQIWVSLHSAVVPLPMRGNYESYGAWFASGLRADGAALVGRTVLRTSGELAGMLEALVSPSMPAAVHLLALLVLIGISALGARELWRRASVSAAFVGLYLAIVVFWPFAPTRFVWGIWPLVMLLPVLGARALLRWMPATRGADALRWSALAASLLLGCGYATYTVRGYQHRWWSSIPRSVSRAAGPLLVWIGTHTSRDALVATEVESTVYLYTGRPVVPVSTFTVDEYFVPRTPRENAAAMRAIVSHYRPQAVVITSGTMRDAARELAFAAPPLLVATDTFPGGGLVLIPTSR
jgi:hypothetical protein